MNKVFKNLKKPDKLVKKVYCIYNANGSLAGEISYMWKKILSGFDCSLCNISHNTFTEKRIWKKEISNFKYELEMLHLDEQSEDLQSFTKGATPCVVSKGESGFKIILSESELKKINGDVPLFFKKLNNTLSLHKFKEDE